MVLGYCVFLVAYVSQSPWIAYSVEINEEVMFDLLKKVSGNFHQGGDS
jgi:hypothetical protein